MVTIQIPDGSEINGHVIHRSHNTIILEITHPFHGVVMDISLPPFVSACNSFNGPYGDDIIRFLLTSLHKICHYADENRGILLEPYRQLCHELDELDSRKLNSGDLDERRFHKKALFFQKWFPNMYLARSSWDGILAMLHDECLRQLPAMEHIPSRHGSPAPTVYCRPEHPEQPRL